MRLRRSTIVVYGSEPLAGSVAEGLMDDGRAVGVLTRDELLSLKPARHAVLVLAEPPDTTQLLADLIERQRARRARWRSGITRVILMHGSDPPPALPPLEPSDRLRLETFAVVPRAVRTLLARWPLHWAMDALFGQTPHLLIAGLDAVALVYLVQALRLIQYGDAPPRVTVLGADPETDGARFLAAYPEAEQIAELRFGALALSEMPPVTLAFVSVGGLSAARSLARTIARDQRCSPPILLEVGDARPSGEVAQWDGQIIPVSYRREACRAGVLLDGVGDEIARSIHEHYRDTIAAQGRDPGSEPAGQPWERLAHSYRQANRHQADHLWAKLAITDCRAVAEEMVESFAFAPLEVERLAIIEHQRWAADRYLDGWRFAPERDNARKHHPQLIPYAALSEPMKDLDRFAVRGVPTLLARSGLGVVRMLIVAIPDPAPTTRLGRRLRGQMERVLERLLTRYPDRALIVAAALSHPDVRATVRQAMERAEAGFFWLLPGPVDTVLADQPDAPARSDLLALAARAERRIMLDGEDALERWFAARSEIVLTLGVQEHRAAPRKRIGLLQGASMPSWNFEY